MRKLEVCSASATLSNPFTWASTGSNSFRSTFTPRRSRRVFSYSTRLSRRRTTRPRASPSRSRCFRFAGDPLGQSLTLFLRWTRFPLRRHLARLNALQHGQPAFAVGLVGKIGSEPIEPQIAFRLFRSVTSQAVAGEK